MEVEEESEWVERAQQDAAAFGPLYDAYIDPIYAFVYRQTHDHAETQDIVAETFEKALNNIGRFQWQGVRFGAWLYKIARNQIAQRRRQVFRWLPLPAYLISPLRVEKVLEASLEQQRLIQAIRALKPADQEIILLFYVEELSHKEIGHILDISENSSAVRLKRALKRLKKEVCDEPQFS